MLPKKGTPIGIVQVIGDFNVTTYGEKGCPNFQKKTHVVFGQKAKDLSRPQKLVGGLEHVLFSHILGIIIPTDELIFFRGVGLNHQPVKVYKLCIKTVGFYPFLASFYCRNSDPSRRGVAPGAPGARAGPSGSKGPPWLERGFHQNAGIQMGFWEYFLIYPLVI